MEVHHHPDFHHKPKKWREHILEFIMIFLAVSMSFFAESYREHLVERKKEKEYIKSMVEDLRNDSSFLAICINERIPYHIAWMDSAIHLYNCPALMERTEKFTRLIILLPHSLIIIIRMNVQYLNSIVKAFI